MKKLLISFCLAFLGIVLNTNGQNSSNDLTTSNEETVDPNGPVISFDTLIVDFGTIDQGSDPFRYAVFTNTGKKPLHITTCKGSCGCTVPDWPKEAIMPNESGEIVVIYRPTKGQAGSQQTKTVTVTANTEPAHTTLNIKASVNPVSE